MPHLFIFADHTYEIISEQPDTSLRRFLEEDLGLTEHPGQDFRRVGWLEIQDHDEGDLEVEVCGATNFEPGFLERMLVCTEPMKTEMGLNPDLPVTVALGYLVDARLFAVIPHVRMVPDWYINESARCFCGRILLPGDSCVHRREEGGAKKAG